MARTYHHISVKHLHRYIGEFVGHHNARSCDTIDQMSLVVRGFEGKRGTWETLTA